MSDETYLTVHGTLVRRSAKAILIKTDQGEGWIPRSCIHAASDAAVDRMADGDEGEFRIMEWAARDKDLI